MNLSNAGEPTGLRLLPVCRKVRSFLARSWVDSLTVGDKCYFSQCNNLFRANHKVFVDVEDSTIKYVYLADKTSFLLLKLNESYAYILTLWF